MTRERIDWFEIELERQEHRARTAADDNLRETHETIARCMRAAREGHGGRVQLSLLPASVRPKMTRR